MFGLLTRKTRTVSSRRPRIARLELEQLERRDVPSLTMNVTYGVGKTIELSGDLTGVPNASNQQVEIYGMAHGTAVTDSNGHYDITLQASNLGQVQATDTYSDHASLQLTDPAPVISFSAVEGANDVWTFTGTITYNRPFTAMTVYLGGAPVSLQGVTCTANDQGTFGISIQLNGTSSDNGTATAVAIDAWGTSSNTATDYIWQTGT
jgi:hypothetical protein